MAVLMENRISATPEVYDAVSEKLGVDDDPPAGMIVHTAVPDGDGLRIVDVWESEDAFQQFRNDRLLPAFEAVMSERGITPEGPPSFDFTEIHHLVKP